MKWLRELFCFHKWETLGVGQNWPACVHLHHLADTVHKCSKCGWQRDWIHTKPIRWNLTRMENPMTSSDRDAARSYADKIISDTDYDMGIHEPFDNPYWSDTRTEEMVNAAYLAGCKFKQQSDSLYGMSGVELEQKFVQVIEEWKGFWMNQIAVTKDQADHDNYFQRAVGVDANMKYHLAKMLRDFMIKRQESALKGDTNG